MCAKTSLNRSSEVAAEYRGFRAGGIAVGHNIRPVEVAHKAVLEERRRGGGGVWNPNICVPKMAHNNFSFCKSHFFPIQNLARGGGGGSPSSYGCQPF